MLKQFLMRLTILGIIYACPIYPLQAQFSIDFETGGVFSGYNDVRIPNATGTLLSFSDDLATDAKVFFRVRCLYTFRERHTVGVLFAPLTLQASGQVDRDVHFEGKTFESNTPLDGSYRFNSYRATYRYDIKKTERTRIGVGLTAKIRDAEVTIEGGGQTSTKPNVGFVPLINFRFLQTLWGNISFLLEVDALGAPQGRAEDVLAAFRIPLSNRIHLRAGYRLLEGGADVDEVYTFTYLHYLTAGMTIRI